MTNHMKKTNAIFGKRGGLCALCKRAQKNKLWEEIYENIKLL